MKTLFYINSENKGCIYISPYEFDNEAWELNHKEIDLKPRNRDDEISCHVEINILANILFLAEIRLVAG